MMTGPREAETTGEPAVLPPRANPVLFGQDAAEAALLTAYASGRMPHGWMLTGPPGIGKATLAFRFARFVLSGGGSSLATDPSSPVFRRVAAGGHPDLLTIARGEERELGVGAIRRIDPFLRLTGAEGTWRVAIVDDADSMNRSAANALLKILEEPPAGALIVIVCANPGRLPATIRSRCRCLALRLLPAATVEAALGRLRPDLGPADRAALAVMAEGSIGRAHDLATGDPGGVETLRTALRVAAGPGPSELMKLVERHGDAEAFRRIADILPWWMARQARRLAGDAAVPAVLEEEGRLAPQLAARFAGPAGLDRWLALWDNTRRLLAQADQANLDRKQVLLQAFLGIGRACDA